MAHIGRTHFEIIKRLTSVHPSSTLFDFGCGIGRISVAALEYLDSGRLVGVDIVQDFVDFCQTNIRPAFPNSDFFCTSAFRQKFDDLDSSAEALRPEDHIFQSLEGQIDIAYAFSVFTHLEEHQMRAYLGKLRNILHPLGALVISAFLLNDFSIRQIREGKVYRTFGRIPGDEVIFRDVAVDVAVKESALRQILNESGFEVETIAYGSWRGTSSGLNLNYLQDCIVARPLRCLPPGFDPRLYISLHPDLIAAAVDGADHYLQHGFFEGRRWR